MRVRSANTTTPSSRHGSAEQVALPVVESKRGSQGHRRAAPALVPLVPVATAAAVMTAAAGTAAEASIAAIEAAAVAIVVAAVLIAHVTAAAAPEGSNRAPLP